ncbi:hypothetical protein ACPPVS_11335 [Cellulomonas sp. McL0617]|uniref:hypothetical protein n=1 Tax=Cellulomonas sp. McL0617 TaxID=3415675 RepID=UPI003CF06700
MAQDDTVLQCGECRTRYPDGRLARECEQNHGARLVYDNSSFWIGAGDTGPRYSHDRG